MKNRLEEFVHHHREDFDADTAVNDLWPAIEANTEKKQAKLFNLFSRKQVAACLLVLVNAAAILYLVERRNSLPEPAAGAPTEQVTAPPAERELDQISRVVEIKQAKLKEIATTNPVLYKTFVSALGQLDNAYRDLEKELTNNPNKEQLLEAMIQNLSLQQELLNQQLSIYQKIKNSRNEKNSNNTL